MREAINYAHNPTKNKGNLARCRNRDRIMQSVPLRFFCFLRAGEFTVPSDQEFNPEVHLTKDDIMVDNLAAP